jgi:hypothetical protein
MFTIYLILPAILRANVSEERITSIIKVNRISELGAVAVTSNSSLVLFTLMTEAIRTSEMSVLTRATRRHIPEDGILHNLGMFNYQIALLREVLIFHEEWCLLGCYAVWLL